ncbi:hypothetical protein NM208_g8651 [Fusarium decemcellulare]|uniref:Uncharacterized protein n=1 Tax=Fusarium decemcellulare TaxID=57161 RepID=A0ACC1S4L1_9HYPO|nr:hypothetical protein NM208_g8651 [Fusarium decemcellulare]
MLAASHMTCLLTQHQANDPASRVTSLQRDIGDDLVDEWSRELGGAWAEFGDGATIKAVSLPSDFSAIRIRNIPQIHTTTSILELLADVNLFLVPSDIRLINHGDSANSTAIIKVKDPAFAKTACTRLGTSVAARSFDVSSIPVPMPKGSSFHQVDSRQVRCSWHRPSRTACLEFGSKKTAVHAFHMFQSGKYKINGTKVMANYPIARGEQREAMTWLVKLSSLPQAVDEEDITKSIVRSDKPGKITIGELSYEADMEIDSTLVQSMLYEFGPLERWDVSDGTKSRRIKAHGTFVEESQARAAASSLHEKPLPFCPASKLFVQLVTSVKFKVSTRVYKVVEERINSQKRAWERQFIRLFMFAPRGSCRILKLEGEDRQLVAQAQKDLECIINGQAMTMDGKNIWHSDFKISKDVYKSVKKIEEDLGVVIIRNASLSQIRVFGPQEHFSPATEALHRLIQDTISSAQPKPMKKARNSDIDCTICLTPAEEPLLTSCNHVYCGLCFVNMCEVEASKLKDFCITCEGNEGTCGKELPILEIHGLLMAETFEEILKSSFSSYVRRHPNEFRYCPTPDCDRIYRVVSDPTVPQTEFTCGKCLVAICTGCNTSHPGMACAELEDDASGHLEKLVRLKEELGVQDCPKCGTLIEKTEGCNHMHWPLKLPDPQDMSVCWQSSSHPGIIALNDTVFSLGTATEAVFAIMEPQSPRNQKPVLSSRRRRCPECQRARRVGRDRTSHISPKNHSVSYGSLDQTARYKVQDLEHIGRPLYDVSLFQTPAIASSLAVKPATKELKKPLSSPKPLARLEQCVAEAEERTAVGRKENKAAKQVPRWRQKCKWHERVSTRNEPDLSFYAKREARLDELGQNRAYVFAKLDPADARSPGDFPMERHWD